MDEMRKTNYEEAVLDFLRLQNERDPGNYFTAITLINQCLTDEERKNLSSRVRNLSTKIQAEFDEILEPLVLAGILEKSVVCSQTFDPHLKSDKVGETTFKRQPIYRLAHEKSLYSFEDYMTRRSLDSSQL